MRHVLAPVLVSLAGFVFAMACGSAGKSGLRSGDAGPDATSSSSGGGSGAGSGGSSGSGSGSDSGGARDSSSGGGEAGIDAGIPIGASVLQFHNHLNRDGLFIDKDITTANAPKFHLDATFTETAVMGNVFASPLYVQNGPNGKGTFYVVSENATIFAIDEATGNLVWQKNVATPAKQTGAGCGNFTPIGITGTPAIDLATRLVVLDSASADSSGNIATHTIYALSIDDGSIKWNVDVSTLQDRTGRQFSPQPQNQRGAVLIVNGIAYVVFGGDDCSIYHGWVVGVPLTGTGAEAWATQVNGAGIWGPGGAASDGQSIYVTTGNGFSSPATWAESEGLFRLDPGPTFTQQTADYFTPYNWQTLDAEDYDLSGSGPLVIDAPSFTPSTLVLAQGKNGFLYLLNRSNLGGIATQTQLAGVGALQVQSGHISNAGAWANIGTTTYIVVRPNGTGAGIGCPNGTSGDLVAVRLDGTAQQKMSVAWCATTGGNGSPSITTSDGTNDALVWVQDAEGDELLRAFDLTTGATVLGSGGTNNTAGYVRHFTTPIAVNGRIFVAGDYRLYAFTP